MHGQTNFRHESSAFVSLVSFNDVSISDYVTSFGVSLVNDEVKKIWLEAVMVYARYSLRSFRKGMKRTMENLKKDADVLFEILNRYPCTQDYSRNSHRQQFFLALVCIRKGPCVPMHKFGCPFCCLEVFCCKKRSVLF